MEFKMPELPKLPKDTKPFCLGALAGAVLIAWLGFDVFGWVLGRTAEAQAKKRSEVAVNAAYAGICAAQFRAGKDFQERLAALGKTDRYSRGDVLLKAGWATIAGIKEPSRDVGQTCADLLIPENR